MDMSKHSDHNQHEKWTEAQRELRDQRDWLKNELTDVESLIPDYLFEALELSEKGYQEPMSLPELFSDFDWSTSYEDMISGQKRIIWEKIYEILGIDINTPILDRYKWVGDKSSPGQGEAQITVAASSRNGLALHHITYADGIVEIAIGLPPQ